MDFIVTRNEKDYNKGKTKVLNAQEFVDLYAAGEDVDV